MLKKVIIAFAILVVLLVIVVAAVKSKKVSGENVYAAEVTHGDIVTVVTGTGVIQPRTKVNVSSEIYGQIVELPVKEGQNIQKGALLVRIDPEKYRSEVDRLAANLRVNKIAIESEEVNLKNLELEQRRATELHRQGVLSVAERERADLASETARIRIKSLKESVMQADAALSRAQTDLGKSTIYAPMAGRITQVNTEVGEQVIVGTTNIPGSVMMVISDMSEVLAQVNVDETEVVRLTPGQKVTVTVDAVEKTTYEGRVTEIGNTAWKQGDVNVFSVKVLLTNPDERLRPGMTAKAKIEVERHENALRIPVQAVTTRERKKLEDEKKSAGRSALKTTLKTGDAAGAGADKAKEPAGSIEVAKVKAESGGGDGGSQVSNSGGGKSGVERSAASDGDGSPEGTPGSASRSSKAAITAGGPAKGERDEIEVVYVIEKDVVHVVPVKTGASDELYVQIQDGLKDGQTVVKGPYRVLKRLKDGAKVIKKDEKEEQDGVSGEPETDPAVG